MVQRIPTAYQPVMFITSSQVVQRIGVHGLTIKMFDHQSSQVVQRIVDDGRIATITAATQVASLNPIVFERERECVCLREREREREREM